MIPIRIVIADDHPIVLAGLRNLIRAIAEFNLAGEAMNGAAALTLIREKSPDIAVVDISMPGLNGISLTKCLVDEASAAKIIVLTVHEDRAYINHAFQAGVQGYVLKRSLSDNLIQAIRTVATGQKYLDPTISAQLINSTDTSGKKSDPVTVAKLTERESEVLHLTALGQTNKEIAARLQVSMKSVETFKARGMKKIGLRTRADIVRYGVTEGWFANV